MKPIEKLVIDGQYVQGLTLDEVFAKLARDLGSLNAEDIVRFSREGDTEGHCREASAYIAFRMIDRGYLIRFTKQRDIERAEAGIGHKLDYDKTKDAYRFKK